MGIFAVDDTIQIIKSKFAWKLWKQTQKHTEVSGWRLRTEKQKRRGGEAVLFYHGNFAMAVAASS